MARMSLKSSPFKGPRSPTASLACKARLRTRFTDPVCPVCCAPVSGVCSELESLMWSDNSTRQTVHALRGTQLLHNNNVLPVIQREYRSLHGVLQVFGFTWTRVRGAADVKLNRHRCCSRLSRMQIASRSNANLALRSFHDEVVKAQGIFHATRGC